MKPHDVVFHAKTLTLYMIVRIYDDGKAQLVCPDGYTQKSITELSLVSDTTIQDAFTRNFRTLWEEWKMPGNPISRVLNNLP